MENWGTEAGGENWEGVHEMERAGTGAGGVAREGLVEEFERGDREGDGKGTAVANGGKAATMSTAAA